MYAATNWPFITDFFLFRVPDAFLTLPNFINFKVNFLNFCTLNEWKYEIHQEWT